MSPTSRSGTVVYDGECGFCTAYVDWGRRHLRTGPGVALRASQDLDLAALGTTAERAGCEVLWKGADGELLGGHLAIAAWLRLGPWWARLASRALRLPPVQPLARRAYRWVADHRRQLPAPRRR